jgi:tetratricopeptide (TPR) repeat protein
MVTATERLLEESQMLPGISRLLWWSDIFAFLGMLAVMNLALAVFNEAPVYPLDGGQIAQDVLKRILGERRANLIMMIFSLPAALALCVAGLILKDIATGLTGLMLLAASLTLNPWLYNKLFLAGLYLIDRPDYYLRNEDYDQAIRAYSHAIQRHPDRAGAYLSRAVAAMNLLDLPAARVDIDRALALDANNATAWTLWGELLALDKDNPAALAAYNRAIELRPNWSVPYLDRGSCYYEQGDYDRALEEINKGIELGSGSPTGYLLRSQFRYERGDINGSHEDADNALAYAPQWMLVFSEIFLTNLAGHLNWSLDYYWRAIERMPKAYQVYQGRGDACRVNHHPDWAIEDYHRAIRLAPRQGALYLARGRAYQELGEPEKAAADFQAAARMGNRPHIRRQAGEALAQLTPGLLDDRQPA